MASARFSRVLGQLAASLPLAAGASAQLRGQTASGCEESPPKPPAVPFQAASCVRNEAHTHDTRLITLKLPAAWNTKGPVANVVVKDGDVARPYNPLSAHSGDLVTLLVKRYGEAAKMGSKLHGLKEGDVVQVKGPNRQWSLPEKGKCKHFGMIAGGTGITPIMQAAEAILEQDEGAAVTLITLNKTSGDVLLRKELKFLQMRFGGRLTVAHIVAAKTGGEDDVVTDEEGSASSELFKAVLPAPSAAGGVMVLVCGRPPMTAAVAGPKTKDFKQGEVGGMLKELGYGEGQVWKF